MDNEYKIMEYLGRHPTKSYTMHDLSKGLKIPYATFYRTIPKIKDLLNISIIGKSKVLSLNLDNDILKSFLSIASYEAKKIFLKKHSIIKKISDELDTKDIVLLFGSYAKEKFSEKSDIDILMINKDGKKSLSFSKYEILYKKNINPIFVTESEFKKMIRSNEENVGKQALNDHIILNNPEKFWKCVIHAIR